MVSRFLEKKVEIVLDGFQKKVVGASDEFQQTAAGVLELEYYLLEGEYTEEGKSVEQKGFGIEVVKRNQGIPNERKQFENIFSSRERTRELVDLLAVNTVTPISLPYVLDDLLGQ